jgi:hypothetical protein
MVELSAHFSGGNRKLRRQAPKRTLTRAMSCCKVDIILPDSVAPLGSPSFFKKRRCQSPLKSIMKPMQTPKPVDSAYEYALVELAALVGVAVEVAFADELELIV